MLVSKLTTLLNNSLTIHQTKQIHALVLIYGLNHLEPLLVRQVLSSAGSYCQSTTFYVQLILNAMQNPEAIAGACTIQYLSRHRKFKDAFAQYVQLHRSGFSPNTYAISSVLKACAKMLNMIGGASIHVHINKYGFCGVVYVQTALVDFYSKLGKMETAHKIFDGMVERNVVSWNSVLAGYVMSGNLVKAHSVFDEMPHRDIISWNSMVSGYGKFGDMDQAYSLFRQMPERNSSSWNAMISGYVECGKVDLARGFFDTIPQRNNVSCIIMISGYSKCGNVKSAREIFDQIFKKDLVLFNAMISCYTQNSHAKEALQLFNEMLEPNVNIQPDAITLASIVSACSQLGDLKFGFWIELYIDQLGLVIDDHLATAFIDLYAKSGNIDKAYELFHCLKQKDLVAYTAMILGCGINGRANDAIKLYEEMMDAEINPNLVTFTGLLTAYNHIGLVKEGYHCFTSMHKYGLVPTVDHYGIMVDLLGRAGKLQEAHELIKSMPMQPHAGVWGALLLSCSLHNNVELAEVAAKHCLELEPDSTGYGTLLANIYASAGRWNDAKLLRQSIEERGVAKIPGCSWMEHS